MSKPFFSVIIPTLNEEKFIPTILRSLEKQTFKNFELFVVDGGSSDKTVEVCKKYKKKIASLEILVSNKANVGYQRNMGAKKACGKYLVFLDADVDISKNYLKEIHNVCSKKDLPLVTTWSVPDSNKPSDRTMMHLGNLMLEIAKVIGKPFAGGWNTIIKKSVFWRLHGFREDIKISEDHDLVLRARRAKIELTILREPVVVYSLRRFRAEGTLKLLQKYTHGQIYNFLKGPITKEIFDYPMGGHVHKKPKSKNKKFKIKLKIKKQKKERKQK